MTEHMNEHGTGWHREDGNPLGMLILLFVLLGGGFAMGFAVSYEKAFDRGHEQGFMEGIRARRQPPECSGNEVIIADEQGLLWCYDD